MKKNILILIILVLFPIKAYAFDNTIKIYDYAQSLNSKEEIKLKQQIDKYINKFKIDMIIVTVRYHEKSDIKEYASDFYNYNKFGINSTKDGILLILDFSLDDKIHIFPMGNAINLYNDLKIKDMLSQLDYSESYYDQFYKLIRICDKSLNSDNSIVQIGDYIKENDVPLLQILLISLLFPVSISLFVFKNSKLSSKNESCNYYDKKDLNIVSKSDKFISTSTSSKRNSKK